MRTPFLTIFSAPKPFTKPHIRMIQRNAIQSWLHLGYPVKVILVGDEEGVHETASEFGVAVISNVARNQEGTPLVSSIFGLAHEASSSTYLAYVNGDILLMPDFLEAVERVANCFKPDHSFLMVGQRWDLQVGKTMEFPGGWEKLFLNEVKEHGKIHPPAGSDYFVFPRTAFSQIPDFSIGRAGWDNWMIFHARQQGWPVIDCTASIKVVHQNHDYSHLPGNQPHYDLQESQKNLEIAGGLAYMYMVLDANYQLVNGHIRPRKIDLLHLIRNMERCVIPQDGNLRSHRGALARRIRKLRRRLSHEL